MTTIVAALLIAIAAIGVFWAGLARRYVHIWIWHYLRRARQIKAARKNPTAPIDVMFCFVDHFEPYRGQAGTDVAMTRVDNWIERYTQLARGHRDADGRFPIHTYFYPEEEYQKDVLDKLARHCQEGFGEVEVHLHHDNDTADGLRTKLQNFANVLSQNHGLLSNSHGGPKFAFIHGNWALDNSRKDGRWCGVNNELIVLREAGCYADFTLPSSTSDTQTSMVNSIYYAHDDPDEPKSHDRGDVVRVGGREQGDLLIFQGPLSLNWRERKLVFWPRIEDGDIWVAHIPIERRIDLWIKQHIHVIGRPEWIFVKIHTHGCVESFADSMFGGELHRMFSYLGRRYNDGANYRLHYVSAREAYNIVKAAEAGKTGNAGLYRDFELKPPTYKRAN